MIIYVKNKRKYVNAFLADINLSINMTSKKKYSYPIGGSIKEKITDRHKHVFICAWDGCALFMHISVQKLRVEDAVLILQWQSANIV